MKVWNVLRDIGETRGETVLSGFELSQPLGQGAMPASLLDDANNFRYSRCSLGKLATVGLGGTAALAVEPVGFLCIGAHCFRHHVRGHQTLTQTRQPLVFERLTKRRCGHCRSRCRAHDWSGEAVLSAPGIGAATTAAEDQTGECTGGGWRYAAAPRCPHGITRTVDLFLVKGGWLVRSLAQVLCGGRRRA